MGDILGKKSDIADGSLRDWDFRKFEHLVGDYYVAPKFLDAMAVRLLIACYCRCLNLMTKVTCAIYITLQADLPLQLVVQSAEFVTMFLMPIAGLGDCAVLIFYPCYVAQMQLAGVITWSCDPRHGMHCSST